MTVNQRFQKIFSNLKYSQTQFAEQIGAKQSVVSRMLSGKVGISTEIMQIMYNKFNVNLNWLICGGGKMHMRDYNTNVDILNEPSSNYSQALDQEAWKEALKAKDELINFQKAEIKRLKEKCGE